jgi:hypothetical protein
MSDVPAKPSRPSRVATPTTSGGLYGKVEGLRLEVKTPGVAEVDFMSKFAQLVMYGIAMLAIWGGILSIAFAEDATNSNFLILGAGGIISATMAIAMVEMQRKRGGGGLHAVHDYLLGIGLFFAAIGVLWGTRYLISIAAGNGVDFLLVEGVPYSDMDWSPSANAIYVQLGACLALIAAAVFYLRKLEGATSFAWSVITFTPIAIAVAGVGPWLSWSGDIVSWQLGISIVTLTFLAMWLALQSNNGVIFAIAAIVSGIIPLLYEVLNENAPEDGAGGALSLLVFIIIGQGVLAADQRLRQSLIQKTSFILVGEVLLAILVAREMELNLILGPLRESMLGEMATYINLQTALWVTLLLAYLPAVHGRRTPWMPIGLAGSIWVISPEASIVPWIITILILPYMLIMATATRTWVANCTFIAAGISFFIQDSTSAGFVINDIELVIAVALIVVGELSRMRSTLSDWAHFLTLGLIVMSKSILLGTNIWVPWLIVLYIIISSWRMLHQAAASEDVNRRIEASAALLASVIMTLILAFSKRLTMNLPDGIAQFLDGMNLPLAILAIIIWASMRRYKGVEMDLGHVFSWLGRKGKRAVPVFESETGAWVILEQESENTSWTEKGWGSIARISLIGPLILFTIAISFVDPAGLATNLQWVLLSAIPLALLTWEILDDEEASAAGRAVATWTLFLMAIPISFALNDYREWNDQVLLGALLFDAILIAGPLVVSTVLSRRGLNESTVSVSADAWALAGLLMIGIVDSSGGLAFLALYTLVIVNSFRYRQRTLLAWAPFALILMGERMVQQGDFVRWLLDKVDFTSYDLTEITIMGMSRFSCAIMALTSAFVLTRAVIDRRAETIHERSMPTIMPGIWLAIGMLGVLPEVSWLLLILTVLISLHSWLTGRLDFIPWMPFATIFSFLIGFSADENFSHFTGGEIFSHSLLGTGLFTLIIHHAADRGILYRWADEASDDVTTVISSFNLKSIAGREQLLKVMRLWTMVCLVLSWDAVYGIGTVIGAGWITWEVFGKGQSSALLLMPILHGFALWNLMEQVLPAEQLAQDWLVGLLLVTEGAAFTWLASNSDFAWNWEGFEFEDETTYFTWLDRVGMMSIAYVLSGILWILDSSGLDSLTWGIISIYMVSVAIQGFREETEAGWRRGFGGFGSIISLFMLSLTIETATYRAVVWLALGILAFGFGILYMQRFSGEEQPFTEVFTAEASTSEEVVEIPEAEEEEEEDNAMQLASEPELIPEMVPEPVTQTQTLSERMENLVEKVPESGLVETTEGFTFRLPPEVLNNIRASLSTTPHEGFRPVLDFDSRGNVILNFEPV